MYSELPCETVTKFSDPSVDPSEGGFDDTGVLEYSSLDDVGRPVRSVRSEDWHTSYPVSSPGVKDPLPVADPL
jgi:hypothetical protein